MPSDVRTGSERSIWKGVRQQCLLLYAFLFPVLLHDRVAAQNAPAPYLAELLQRAESARLWDDPYWHVLLHYRRGRLGGWVSRIDDAKFFAAPDGKTNPRHELQATLHAFFAPVPPAGERCESIPREGCVDSVPEPSRSGTHDTFAPQTPGTTPAPHPVSRWTARFEWLKAKLHVDTTRLPVAECAAFEAIWADIKPRSVVLVFPSAFLNSPASMFGHTLLNVRSWRQSELLNQAITYSAFTRETNGILFAVKGICGLYSGYYSVLPYYRKVQEYNDINKRDIWEYDLNLTEPEVRRLMLHTWELRDIASDYYFFTENCANNLLYLLDAARPGLRLAEQTRPWVIPLDTVRVVRNAGLINAVHYRPSKATRTRHIASLLDARLQTCAAKVVRGEMTPDEVLTMRVAGGGGADLSDKSDTSDLSNEPAAVVAKARVLDLAAEVLQGAYGAGQIEKTSYVGSFLAVLQARSRLGVPEASEYRIPEPVAPDRGHGSMRLSLGGGWEEESGRFQELEWRPAYHSLIDADEGYQEGAHIEFSRVVVRHYDSPAEWNLARWDFLRILSLSPVDRFVTPMAWKADISMIREPTSDGRRRRYGLLSTGGGWACRLAGGTAYVMLETEARAGGFNQGWAVGAGPGGGWVANLTPRWKIHAHVRGLCFYPRECDEDLSATLEQRFTLAPWSALALAATHRHAWDRTDTLVGLRWMVYY